jgi:hypothetical protein
MAADPTDLMLAYNEDFVGLTTTNTMAQTLEVDDDPKPPATIGVLGGTADPDGYYEDFTSRLDDFVRNNPRIGGSKQSESDGPRSAHDLQREAGVRARQTPQDLTAMVIVFDVVDSDAEDGESAPIGGAHEQEKEHPEDKVISLGDYLIEARVEGGAGPHGTTTVAHEASVVPVASSRSDNIETHPITRAESPFLAGEMDETEIEQTPYAELAANRRADVNSIFDMTITREADEE